MKKFHFLFLLLSIPLFLFASDYRGTLTVDNWNPVSGKNGPEVANLTVKWNLSDANGKPAASFHLQWYLGLNYHLDDSLYRMRTLGEVKELISIRTLVMEADVISDGRSLGTLRFDLGATPPHGGLWGDAVTYQYSWRNFLPRAFDSEEERQSWEERLRESFEYGISLEKLRIYRLDFGGLQFVHEEIRFREQQAFFADIEKKGDQAFAAKNYLQAVKLYRQVITANPDAAEVREKINRSFYYKNMAEGDSLFARKDLEAALKAYQAAADLPLRETEHVAKMELVQTQINQRNQTQQLWQQLQDQYNEKAALAAAYAEDAFNKAVLAENEKLESCYLVHQAFYACEEAYFNEKKAKAEAEARYKIYNDPRDLTASQVEKACTKPYCSLTAGITPDSLKTASYHLAVAKRKFLRHEEFDNNEAFLLEGKEQLSLALALDSTLAEAYLLKAYLATDVIEQLASVDKAIALDPNHKEAKAEKESLQGAFVKELGEKITAGDVAYIQRARQSDLLTQAIKIGDSSLAAFALQHDQAEVLAVLLSDELKAKNTTGSPYQDLLEMAAAENKLRSATYLLTQGADPVQLGASGKSPMLIATEKESMEVLDVFLTKVSGTKMKEALLLSVEKGNSKLLDMFAAKGADFQASDALGDNLLMIAIRLGHNHLIDGLLEKGVDVNHSNNAGNTALTYAAEKRAASIIQKLLSYQAELTPSLEMLNGKDAKSVQFLCEEALTYFMKMSEDAQVKGLVAYHPQLALVKHPIGSPFIFHALALGQEEIALSLLASEKKYDEQIEGKYLLMEAIHAGADSLVEELVYKRATNINIQNEEEESPLHVAVQKNNRKISVLLLAQRHPLNLLDRNGRTPLHIALLAGHKELASMLIGNGADLTLKDNKDWQPVHMAAYANDLHHLGLLIEKGANVNATGESGMTPLHYAAQNANLPMIEYLLAAGADKTIEDYFGRTPYKIARKARQNEIARWLK